MSEAPTLFSKLNIDAWLVYELPGVAIDVGHARRVAS